MSVIKTPDQRVRVFISSTIGELADERKAATEAITKLRLTPVLFELGARPHPPRELYRAYLEQSHIFVGIYWNSYGWVAPDMTISGLEDEYVLSEEKTRLIYVKQTSVNRDEKLTTFLQQIEKSGNVCYRNFSTAEELKELLENDLALLLSEKFGELEKKSVLKPGWLPVIHSQLIGRERELQELEELVVSTEVSLVTLTGAGGTGKTRLAVELAQKIKAQFKDGTYYVSLASVTDEKLVASSIAHVLGLFDSGKQSVTTTLLDCLHDKNILLVLDNFEQVVRAAVLLSEILERCTFIKIIVTSRTPLHIRNEHVVHIEPLQHAGSEQLFTRNEILKFPSVELFIQRAKAVNPHLPLDEENIRAISEICRRLDGLPLAIELAASRAKFLSPVALQSRMSKTLDLLSRGHRDLPNRQKTLRSTIDWSYNLLDAGCQKFFQQLSVFRDGWTMESSQAVAVRSGTMDCDIMDVTEKLLDFGLIRTFSFYNEEQATVEPRFTMLQTVLEYAEEMLRQSREVDVARKAHAEYFISLAESATRENWLVSNNHVIDRIEREYQNLRAAFWNSLQSKRLRDAWRLVRALNHYWMTSGRLGEAVQWVEAAGIAHDSPVPDPGNTEKDNALLAGTLLSSGIVMFNTGNYPKAKEDLKRSAALYNEAGVWASAARALIYLGVTMLSRGDAEAVPVLQEAKSIAKKINDTFSLISCAGTLAEGLASVGRIDEAEQSAREGEQLARQVGNKMMLAVMLMQKGNMLNAIQQFERAEEAFKESLIHYEASGFKIYKAWANLGLGHAYRERKNFENARMEYEAAIRGGRQTGENVIAALGLLGLASMSLMNGLNKKAARLLGKVDDSIKELGYSYWLADRTLREHVTETLRKALPEAEFKREYDLGKTFTLEQSVALAMEDAVKVGAE